MTDANPTEDQQPDPVFLQRQVAELQSTLRTILEQARDTCAAANCRLVHRQLLGQARELLDEADNDRVARYMELEAMEESDQPDSGQQYMDEDANLLKPGRD